MLKNFDFLLNNYKMSLLLLVLDLFLITLECNPFYVSRTKTQII